MEITPDADLNWALSDIRQRSEGYLVWDRYMDGEHDLALTSKRWRTTFGHIVSALALNLCPSIVGALSDRLGITGFTAPDAPKRRRPGGAGEGPSGVDSDPTPPGPSNEDLAVQATLMWGPRMVIAENQVTDDALTYGDGFVAVDRDPTTGKAVIWPQNPGQCAVRYSTSEPGVVEMAVKVWPVSEGKTKRYRANVYYREFTFRYITEGKHQTMPDKAAKFVAYDEDPDVYPVEENVTGVVPIFHFGNQARINQYGKSELAVVKPVQDALNKQVLDIVVGSEYVALPQRWATGVGGSDDQQQGVDGVVGARKRPRFRPGVDRIWTSSNAAASFGEFPGADLSRLIPVADFYKVSAAQITGTPSYYMMLMGGEPPSGESLKVADARLVKRAIRRQDTWGSVWVMVILTAMALENNRAVDLNLATGLRVQWANPEVRNNKEDAEVATMKQAAGVSQRRSLLEIGYTDEEVDEFQEEKQAEQAAALAAGMAAMAAGAVGGFPPVQPSQVRLPPFGQNGQPQQPATSQG